MNTAPEFRWAALPLRSARQDLKATSSSSVLSFPARHRWPVRLLLMSLAWCACLLLGGRAHAAVQPLPGVGAGELLPVPAASSLRLSDVSTPQCTEAVAGWRQGNTVTVSHDFVLPESSAELKALLDGYAQTYRFMALGDWQGNGAHLSRRFSDPNIDGYHYSVDLVKLDPNRTAMCVSVLALD